MLLTNIVMILLSVAITTYEALHYDKSQMSYLVQKLRPNDNFLSDVTKNIQKAVNSLFHSLHLSDIFSKEPKIKVILEMIYHLDDISHMNLLFYETLRNVSAVDADNRTINQMRMHELIIRILNEKQVDVNDETDDGKSENTRHIQKGEENESSDYEVDQSERRNLEVWEPPTEIDSSNISSRRLFGGRKAHIASYPFVASIHILNEFMCAGAIISQDLIITAASCLQLHYNNRFFRENPRTTVVRVGSDWLSRRGEVIPVLEIFFHPQYDPKTLHHNVAIMRLQKTLHFHSRNRTKVRRILLDQGEGNLPVNLGQITLLGWGAKSSSQVINTFDKLNYILLPFYSSEECKKIYSNPFVGTNKEYNAVTGDDESEEALCWHRYILKRVLTKEFVTVNHFCAGFLSKGGGACNKDVGAPAVMAHLLVGIVSFGPPVCGAPDAPTVFTRIGYYINWIARVTAYQPHPYGVPTTSPRLNEYLYFEDRTAKYTLPDMNPINLLKKSFLETTATTQPPETAPMDANPSLRAKLNSEDDAAVIRKIISDVNDKDEVVPEHELMNEDLYYDHPTTDKNLVAKTSPHVGQINASIVFRSKPSTNFKSKKIEAVDGEYEYL